MQSTKSIARSERDRAFMTKCKFDRLKNIGIIIDDGDGAVVEAVLHERKTRIDHA
jgi:hypothetical protein